MINESAFFNLEFDCSAPSLPSCLRVASCERLDLRHRDTETQRL